MSVELLAPPVVPSRRLGVRRTVFAFLVCLLAAAVCFAVPAQQAYAFSVAPIVPQVLGAIGEAAVVGGEAVAVSSGVVVAGAVLAVLAVGAAAWYLNTDHSTPDGAGPVATGPLTGSLKGPQDGAAATGMGYINDYTTIEGGAWSDAHTFTRNVVCHEYDDTRSTKYCPGPDWPGPAATACVNPDGSGYIAGANGNNDGRASSQHGIETTPSMCGVNTAIGVYYPPANGGYTAANGRYFPNPFAGPAGAADLVFTAVAHCVPADGTPMFSVTKTGTFGQGALPSAQCPAGSTVSSVDFTSASAANPAMAPISVGTITNNVPTTYPNCAAGCKLRVLLDGNPCRVGVADCYDWQNVAPARVSCSYGTYTLGLADCDPLAYAYRSGNGLTFDPTSPNQRPVPAMSPTDPRPDPTRGPGTAAPAPSPTVQPAPTGTAAPTPTGNPSATPSPSASPSATPVPPPGSAGAPGPGDSPTTDESSCFPHGWGVLNPLEWVYRPIKCALVWAFVPSVGAVQTQFGGVRDALAVTGPGVWVSSSTAMVATIASNNPGGCEGIRVAIPLPGMAPLSFAPYSACAEPMRTVAGIMHLVLTVGAYLGSFVAILRIISAAFGLAATPGGGDE